MTVIYSPIDLEPPRIDADRLRALFERHCQTHYTGLWSYYTIRQKHVPPSGEWNAFTASWRARYEEDGRQPVWEEEFAREFPEATAFLESLPFRALTHINILRQLRDVPPHLDYDKGEPTFTQPLCYKWLIVPVRDSFFVERPGGERHYINPPERRECFVIAETAARHGAVMREGDKLIVSIFGLLDHDRHAALVERSTAAWAGEVVRA